MKSTGSHYQYQKIPVIYKISSGYEIWSMHYAMKCRLINSSLKTYMFISTAFQYSLRKSCLSSIIKYDGVHICLSQHCNIFEI